MAKSALNAEAADIQGQEFRSSLRQLYPYSQKVAPIVEGRMPSAGEFFAVRCKDLSGGGIAIFLDSPPQFTELLVALGSAPELIFVTAEVKHVERVERDGRPQYLVGCRFKAQLEMGQ